MNDRKTAMQMFDESIRVERMIPLALSCHDSTALPDVFVEDFYEHFLGGSEPNDKSVQPLIETLPAIKELLERDAFEDMEADEVAEWFIDRDVYGFLVQIATPVRQYGSGSDTSWMSSWGHYYTTWVYVESPDKIAAAATAWAEKQTEHDKAKAA
jgi:hypothetical protein